jgi:hypothetical protein
MNLYWIILANAVGIFPIIITSSSMKLILSQLFKISLSHSTIVSYAGIIGMFKFLLVNKVKNTNLGWFKMDNYKQWAFLGSNIMSLFFLFIYILLCFPIFSGGTLALMITILTIFIIIGEIISDTAINIFYSHHKDPNLSSAIFNGHKIAALLGYFLFPMIVDYGSFHGSFIFFIILSFVLNLTVFYLPSLEIPKTKEKSNVIQDIIKDLKNIPNIKLIMLFIVTCQIGTLIIGGMKCNFIAQVTKKKFLSYILRGIGLVVGMAAGMATNFFRKFFDTEKSPNKTFLLGAFLHFVAVIINFLAFKNSNNVLFITATVFENINKGFMMASLMKFFLLMSKNKPHILTFFWGLFSLLRSFYGGISGYLVVQMGVDSLFFLLMGLSAIPIVLVYFLKEK